MRFVAVQGMEGGRKQLYSGMCSQGQRSVGTKNSEFMLRCAHLSKNCLGGLSMFGIPPKKLSPAKPSAGARTFVKPRMSCTYLSKEGGNSCWMLPMKQRMASLVKKQHHLRFHPATHKKPQVHFWNGLWNPLNFT